MLKLPRAVSRTPVELEARIAQRLDDALRLRPDSTESRKIMKEIAWLRLRADLTRWIRFRGRNAAK
jgi:hypothetical protein